MNVPLNNLSGNKICIGAVGIAIIALLAYFIAMAHGYASQVGQAGIYIGAYGFVTGVWSFYDTVIRTQQGWPSAFGPLGVTVAGTFAVIMG